MKITYSKFTTEFIDGKDQGGVFVNRYETLKDAAESVNGSASALARAFKEFDGYYKGYYFEKLIDGSPIPSIRKITNLKEGK